MQLLFILPVSTEAAVGHIEQFDKDVDTRVQASFVQKWSIRENVPGHYATVVYAL